MSLSAKRPSKAVKEKLLKDVLDAEEPTKRLNADINATLYKKIKTQCVIEDRSISDITRQLWIEYLEKCT
ncbi:MAG: hypothetical protein GC137_10565 [Alphaproteobacteria bacterium]|nr:hypothetical protein [Alphaproteobacteria bacterium]